MSSIIDTIESSETYTSGKIMPTELIHRLKR